MGKTSRLMIIPILLCSVLILSCGEPEDDSHLCLDAVTKLDRYTFNYQSKAQNQAKIAMSAFCNEPDCILAMNFILTDPALLALVADIAAHCPCKENIYPSVPLGDFNKLKWWCKRFPNRQYSFFPVLPVHV